MQNISYTADIKNTVNDHQLVNGKYQSKGKGLYMECTVTEEYQILNIMTMQRLFTILSSGFI